jgi:hypothetical protein
MAEYPFIALWDKCEQATARNQGATPPAATCIDDEVPRAPEITVALEDGLRSTARWFGVSF